MKSPEQRCAEGNCPYRESMQVPAWVYFMYDEDDVCLYIGQTMDVPRRIGNHRSGSDWFQWVRRVEQTAEPMHRHQALVVEHFAIESARPVFNLRSNPDYWYREDPYRPVRYRREHGWVPPAQKAA